MKSIRLIIILPVLMACWACMHEEDTGGSDRVTVKLSLPGAELRTYGIPPLPGESKIGNVYLFFYTQGAGSNASPVVFYSETGLDAELSWSKILNLTAMGITPGEDYDVYVLANLPAGTTPPTATTTKGQLFALTETQFPRNINDPKISLFGKKVHTGGNAQLPVSLERTVAKIDLQVVLAGLPGWTITGASIVNERQHTAYVTGEPSDPARLVLSDMTPTGEPGKFRYYVYENAEGEEPDMLKIHVGLLDPDGWPTGAVGLLNVAGNGSIRRNSVYNATMTIGQPGPAIVPIILNVSPWDDRIETIQGGIPLAPQANSYILKPGGTVYVPVSQANRHNAAAIGAQDELTAGLVWSEVKGIAPDGVVKEILLLGKGPEAVVKVTSGTAPGNAVVAVKKDGNIVWSWHIWVTGYDPAATAETYTGAFGSGTLMGCNLGATDNSAANTIASMGLLYQWGRKDPFPFKPASTLTDGTSGTNIFDAAGAAVQIVLDDQQASINQSVLSPATMYTRNDWLPSGDLLLWRDNAGAKTVYDPCPYGWRVPDVNEIIKLWGLFTSSDVNGLYMTSGYFLPYVGTIRADASYSAIPCIQMSEGIDATTARVLRPDIQNIGTISREWGVAIRCVKYPGEP